MDDIDLTRPYGRLKPARAGKRWRADKVVGFSSNKNPRGCTTIMRRVPARARRSPERFNAFAFQIFADHATTQSPDHLHVLAVRARLKVLPYRPPRQLSRGHDGARESFLSHISAPKNDYLCFLEAIKNRFVLLLQACVRYDVLGVPDAIATQGATSMLAVAGSVEPVQVPRRTWQRERGVKQSMVVVSLLKTSDPIT